MSAVALSINIRPLVAAETLPDLGSGDDDLDAFLRDDAARLNGQGVVTIYVAHVETTFVGYVALLADCISVNSSERKKLKLRHDDHPSIPALKIGRLAVRKPLQGQGIGTALIRFSVDKALSIAELVGCRLLTLDAYPERVEWYERLGFVRNRKMARDAVEGWRCPAECPEYQDIDGTRVSMRLDFTAEELPGLFAG